MADHSKMPENNNDGWDSYAVSDLYSKAGAAWVPVFEALASKLTSLDSLVLGFAIRSAKGGRALDMKASDIAVRIGVTRGAVQQSASRLVRLGLLHAEPQRIERVKIINGHKRVTTERLPTLYTPNVAAIAHAIGLPARPASCTGRKAQGHRAPAATAGPAAPARAAETHVGDIEDAYARFCGAFPCKPGKKDDETRREWGALLEKGYPLDGLADLGVRYIAASLGEPEKARYPLTFLRKKDLVCALLGNAPRSDRYLIENWGIPFVTGDYWFISPKPTSGLRDRPCLGHVLDLPTDPEEVRRVFAAGLADARARRAPLDGVNYATFVTRTEPTGTKSPT